MVEQRRHHASPHSAPEANGPSANEGAKAPEVPVAQVLTGMTWTKSGMAVIGGRNQRRVPGNLTYGDGVNAYPSGGIPLPFVQGQGGMGLMRHLDYIEILDISNNGAAQGMTIPTYVFDKTHLTLRLFHPSGAGGLDSKDATEYLVTDIPPAGTIVYIVAVGI